MERMFINKFGVSAQDPTNFVKLNSDLQIEGTERDLKNVDWTLTHLTDS